MELKWKLHQFTYKPAVYTATETPVVMGVKRGTLVRAIALRIGEDFTPGKGETISIGDEDNPVNYMGTDEAGLTVGLKNATGNYLVTQDTAGVTDAANGKLYDDDNKIILTYTGAAEVVAGLCTVYVVYAEIE